MSNPCCECGRDSKAYASFDDGSGWLGSGWLCEACCVADDAAQVTTSRPTLPSAECFCRNLFTQGHASDCGLIEAARVIQARA